MAAWMLEVCLMFAHPCTSSPACQIATTIGGDRYDEGSQLRYRPRLVMEPIALNAVGDHSMGIPSRNARAVMAHTAFTGVCVKGLTAAHTRYMGTPPSRAKLHSILQARMETSSGVPVYLMSCQCPACPDFTDRCPHAWALLLPRLGTW